jgi:DNA-binding NtrC family response regulator
VNSVLLVEDEHDLRVLLGHMLFAAGYRVDSAASVAEAGAFLDRNTYDLVLADVVLADGSGIAIADRAIAAGAKAIVMTGYAFRILPSALMRYEYLLKPVGMDELLRAIERVLATS